MNYRALLYDRSMELYGDLRCWGRYRKERVDGKYIAVREGDCPRGFNSWLLDPCHIEHRKSGGRKGSEKERVNDISNLLLLCRDCHTYFDRSLKR